MPSTACWSTARAPASAAGLLQGCGHQEHARQPARPHRPDRHGHRTVHRLAVSWAWAIPRTSLLVGEFSYTEQQLVRPRPESARQRCRFPRSPSSASSPSPSPISWTAPLAAGFDLYETQTNYQQATYYSDTTGGGAAAGLPDLGIQLGVGCATAIKIAGRPALLPTRRWKSSWPPAAPMARSSATPMPTTTWTMSGNPPRASTFSFSQDFAGFGGNLRFIKTRRDLRRPTRPCSTTRSSQVLTLKAGYITGYDGTPVPINQRFFKGGDSFRGFELAGIGPRDIDAPVNTGAIGGNCLRHRHAGGALALPAAGKLWHHLALFTDFGTLGRVDNVIRAPAPAPNMPAGHLRQGQSGLPRLGRHQRGWKSPFGPVQIDLAFPISKQL